jgi:apolipoprotein N-acyltransferase
VERGARLVVWSEECMGNTFSPEIIDNPAAVLARDLNTYLVVGYSALGKPLSSNCAAIVDPDGRVAGIHRKMYLYMGEVRDVQAGREARAFETPLGRIGMEICFDSCHPEVTRREVRDGARLIAVPNHDPPAPRGVFHLLHGAIMPFRAVENGVPIVRCDANGDSQMIDSAGRVLGESPLFKPDILVANVALGDGRGTFYTRWGDWLVYLSVAWVVGSWLARRRPAKPANRR